MRRVFTGLLALTAVASAPTPAAAPDEADDLRAARALFERNIAAIQRKDRDAYLACYRATGRLVRTGPEGMELGFESLASSTAASGSDEWPESLVARDLRFTWLGPGQVYGTYRYRVTFGTVTREGISERLFLRDPEGWRIAVTSAFDAPPGTPAPPIVLAGATVHDGRGGAPIEDAVIVVRGGRIEAIGPRARTPIPEGVDVVDLAGAYVTPGLVDTHVHYSQTGWADGRPDALDVRDAWPYEIAMATCEAHPDRFHQAFLASGVTAVFDVGGYPWTRRLQAATELSSDAPHVAAAGPLLSTWLPGLELPDSKQFVLMDDEESVRLAVRSHAAAGSDAIKVWFIVRDPDSLERGGRLAAVAGEEARRLGLPLVVHATTLESARLAIAAGARLLVHSVDDRPVDDAFVRAAVDAGVFYCPTLTVYDGYFHLYRRVVPDEVRSLLAWVDPSVRERVLATEALDRDPDLTPERIEMMEARRERRFRIMAANLVRLHKAGVRVVLGTDAGNPLTLHGPSVFAELEAMQRAGLRPLDVLTAATRHAAGAMGRGEDLGTLEPGRIADLLVLERDPTADIANVRSIRHVMRAGVLRERRELASGEE